MEKKRALSSLSALSEGVTQNEHSNVQKMEIVPSIKENCEAPAPTVSRPINVGHLKNSGGDVITYDVTNGAPGAVTLIFGLGLLNRTGTPANFGVLDAAVDEPLAVDDFGAGTPKMSFSSEWQGTHSYIIDSVKIFDVSAAQASVAPEFVTITPNGDLRRTRAHNIERNVDLNYIRCCNLVI